MRADRVLIGAVLVLGAGLWDLFAFCKGTAGLAFALPVSASRVNLNLTTTGGPVLIGIPLLAAGVLLLVASFFLAIVAQFRSDRPVLRAQTPVRDTPPFEG